MFSNARGMAICIGVTGVASILLWFYFKNRIESVETKLDNMFNMIQNFAQQPGSETSNEVNDYYQQQGEVTEDPFENKELQYENQNSSPQLPTSEFEKEIENVVNSEKLIEVSDDSQSESESESDSEEDDDGEEEGKKNEEVDNDDHEEEGKKNEEVGNDDDEEETDSLDEVEDSEEESEEDDEVKKVEMKEEVKEYSSMKVSELKKLAANKGLTGYTKLNKAGLVNLLENN